MKNMTDASRRMLRMRAQSVDLRATPQQAFERILHKHRAVGGAISLLRGGRVVLTLTAGLARREEGIPVGEDTIFRCASVSKMIMALGALRLCEQGRLTLDGDIGDVLGFRVRNPRYPHMPVTLRQLLTHTAGLSDAGGYASGKQDLEELLSRAENYLPMAPGEGFAYSNLGAGAAGCAMERVTGERLETLLEGFIFKPLGVNASFAPQRIAAPENIANGYHVRCLMPPRLSYDAQKISAAPLASFNFQRDYFIAPGRMLASSKELAMLLSLVLSKDGMGVLRPESLTQMRACQDGRGSVRCAGRGLNTAFLDGVYTPGRLYGHQGVAYGMCTEAWGDPDTGEGVVFQTNGARLTRTGPLMHVGADALALGFALLNTRKV